MSENRKFSFGDALFSSTFIHNPVLVQAAGLCAIVAVATTLKTAVLLAVAFFPVIIINQVFACLALKRVPRWIRVAVYLLIGTAILAAIGYGIEKFIPEVALGANIYLFLTAANSIIALHCEKLAVKTNLRHAFYDAVATAIGYAAVIIPVGAVREIVGSATLWGKSVKMIITYPAILMPFGGFLVLAFLAAAHKAVINKHFPEQSSETELEIKKTAVIISKKNLPENAPVVPEEVEEKENESDESETVEEQSAPEQTQETEEQDNLEHIEQLEEGDRIHSDLLGEIFVTDETDSADNEFGSELNRLFNEAADFNAEGKEADR